MVQLGLTTDFKHQFLQLNGATVHMKDSISFLGQSNLTKREMHEVEMYNPEPASMREATEQMVKILDSIYSKANLKQPVNSIQLNNEEINLLLSLLEDLEYFFDGTLGDWATEPVDLELKPYYKPFNSRYYPVPIINKEIFRKELKILVEI